MRLIRLSDALWITNRAGSGLLGSEQIRPGESLRYEDCSDAGGFASQACPQGVVKKSIGEITDEPVIDGCAIDRAQPKDHFAVGRRFKKHVEAIGEGENGWLDGFAIIPRQIYPDDLL